MQTLWRSSLRPFRRSRRSFPLTRRSWWGWSLRRPPIRSRSCCYRVSYRVRDWRHPGTQEIHWRLERGKSTKHSDDEPHSLTANCSFQQASAPFRWSATTPTSAIRPCVRRPAPQGVTRLLACCGSVGGQLSRICWQITGRSGRPHQGDQVEAAESARGRVRPPPPTRFGLCNLSASD